MIDKKGVELPLGENYSKYHDKASKDNQEYNQNVDYIWFDYHRECKNMKTHNIIKLIKEIENNLKDYGFYFYEFEKNVQGECINKRWV